MQTLFDIREKVHVPGTVNQIHIKENGTIEYEIKIDDDRNPGRYETFVVIKEEDITHAETGR